LSKDGWPSHPLRTTDGRVAKPYSLWASGGDDFDDIGGIGLRLYFDILKSMGCFFGITALASVASVVSNYMGSKMPEHHGMYALADAMRFRSQVASTTLGNIYANETSVKAGTVKQLWVNSVTECIITLGMVVAIFFLARRKKKTTKIADDSLISMSDYTLYIRPFKPGCVGLEPLPFGRCHWQWPDDSRHGSWVLPDGQSPSGFARALAHFIEDRIDATVQIAATITEDGRPAKQMWCVLDEAENIQLWQEETKQLYLLEKNLQAAHATGDTAAAERTMAKIQAIENALEKMNNFSHPEAPTAMRNIVGVFVTLERQAHVAALVELSKSGRLGTFNPHKILAELARDSPSAADKAMLAASLETLSIPKQAPPVAQENRVEAVRAYEPEDYIWENLQYNWVTALYWRIGIYIICGLVLGCSVFLIVQAEKLKETSTYLDMCSDVVGPDATLPDVCKGAGDDPAARAWYKATFLQSTQAVGTVFPIISGGPRALDGCSCDAPTTGAHAFECCMPAPCTNRTDDPVKNGFSVRTWDEATKTGKCHRVDYAGILARFGDLDAMCYACACREAQALQENSRDPESPPLTAPEKEYLEKHEQAEKTGGAGYCDDWQQDFKSAKLWGYAGTVIIVVINQVMKRVLLALTKYERQDTQGLFQKSLSLKIFLCTVMNTAVLFLLIRSTLFMSIPGDHYSNADAKWYANLAAPLVMTMLTQYLSTAAISLAMACIGPAMRCCFAKGAKTQNALNLMYEPPRMSLAAMYAELLLGMAVCGHEGHLPPPLSLLHTHCFVSAPTPRPEGSAP
jgi:hypothetical protein